MFTGIIEETGTVEKIAQGQKAIALTILAKNAVRGLKIGGSLAVNGCCLTTTDIVPRGKMKAVRFDLLEETWRRTNFQHLKLGSLANLERPLRATGEFGGHFVTGHVDGTGKISRWEKSGSDYVLDVVAPANVRRYLIEKGSIAIDGISLTVAGISGKTLRVWIIPHTFEITNLRGRKKGELVNLEADLLGKYAEKFARRARAAR